MALIRTARNGSYETQPLLRQLTLPSLLRKTKTNILLRYSTPLLEKMPTILLCFQVVWDVRLMHAQKYLPLRPNTYAVEDSSPGTNGSEADFDLHPQCVFQSYTHGQH